MAKLEIRVTGQDRLTQGGGGADLSRQLRVQGQLADRIGRSLQESVGQLNRQFATLSQTVQASLSRGIARGAQAGAQSFTIVNQTIQASLTQTATVVKNEYADIGKEFSRSMLAELRRVEREQAAAARRARRQWETVARAAGGATRGLGSGVGSGLSGFGGGIGGALGSIGSGGFGLTGILRSATGAGSSLLGGLGSGLSGLTRGLGSGLGGAANAIPGIGPLLSGITQGVTGAVAGGLQAAASVGSGVLEAAGNLATGIVGKLTSVIQVGLVGGIVLAVSSVAEASQFSRLEQSFQGLARSIGTDATTALQGFRTATRGTISDVDLLTQANRAIILGAVGSQAEFEKLSAGAIQLGRAVGRDAKESIDDLTLGLARQSRLLLDNLGIIVNAEAAYQRFAEATGRTAAQLTDAERRTAFQAEGIAALDRALVKIGPVQRDYGETVEQLGAAFSNLQVSIGAALLPILERVTPELTRITQGITAWLSENQVQIADRLSNALSGIPDVLSGIANFIQGNSLGSALGAAERAVDALADGASRALQAVSITAVAEGRALLEELGAEIQAKVNELARVASRFSLGGIVAGIAGEDPFGIASGDAVRATGAASAQKIRDDAAVEAAKVLQGVQSPVQALVDAINKARAEIESSRAPGGAPRPSSQAPTTNGVVPATLGIGPAGLGVGFGFGGGGPGQDPVVAAAAVEANLRGVLGSLELLGITLAELPEGATALARQIAESEERTAALREEAARFTGSALSRSTQATLEAERERLRAVRDESRERERVNSQIERQIREIEEGFRETRSRLTESFERAQAQIVQEDEQLRAQATARRDSAVSSRFNQLAGAGGGLDGISLPLNVFKAIEDVRRQDAKRVFDQLRLATQGLSSSDLSANNGELLRSVLTAQAERDTGATRTLTAELAAISEGTRATLATTAEDFRVASQEVAESYVDAMDGAVSALEAGTAEFERLSAINADLTARIAAVERRLEAIARIERLARS